MNTVGYINVSLETFGGLLSVIFIICLYITHFTKEKLERLYIRLLICNTILLFCDAAAWLFKGNLNKFAYYAVRFANFWVYILGYVILALFTHYLYEYICSKRMEVSKKSLYIIYILAAVSICLVVISQFNNMYYHIDESNFYHRGNWFWLSQVFGVIGLVMNGSTLICYRKIMKKREFGILALYVCVPVLALIFQILFYSIAVLYLATTICVLCIYINIQVEISSNFYQKEMELERSRVSLMLSQIQPHFIFNALSSIKALCDIDSKRASTALEHFSFFLRGNLDSLSDIQVIPFEKEVTHVKDYLYLEKMRFEEGLNIIWELKYTDFMLPPLTLQPIVENAVRYGITQKEDGGTLTIRSEREGSEVIITVIDDGMGFDVYQTKADGRSHVGIENVQKRIRSQCGGELIINSKLGEGTVAKMILPQ